MIDIGLLMVAAMQMHCPSVPVTEADEAELAILTAEVIPKEYSDQFFESESVSKCVTSMTGTSLGEIQVRTVTATFVGHFDDRSEDRDAKVQDFVRCRVSRTYFDERLRALDKDCQVGTRTLLTYPGVEEPIELLEGMTIARARELMAVLSQHMGQSFGGKTLGADEFGSISRISVFLGRNRATYHAYYQVGCQSSSIKLRSSSTTSIEVQELDWSGSIC